MKSEDKEVLAVVGACMRNAVSMGNGDPYYVDTLRLGFNLVGIIDGYWERHFNCRDNNEDAICSGGWIFDGHTNMSFKLEQLDDLDWHKLQMAIDTLESLYE